MKKEILIERIDQLLQVLVHVDQNPSQVGRINEVLAGTTSLLSKIYGPSSNEFNTFGSELVYVRSGYTKEAGIRNSAAIAKGFLNSMKSELEKGLVDNVQRGISGEIFGDFLALSKTALAEPGDESLKVAAVLLAALFEDTMRRLAIMNQIENLEKLETLLGELKKANLLVGSQISMANSFLTFRNNALHARWEKIGRPETEAVYAFMNQILLERF